MKGVKEQGQTLTEDLKSVRRAAVAHLKFGIRSRQVFFLYPVGSFYVRENRLLIV